MFDVVFTGIREGQDGFSHSLGRKQSYGGEPLFMRSSPCAINVQPGTRDVSLAKSRR